MQPNFYIIVNLTLLGSNPKIGYQHFTLKKKIFNMIYLIVNLKYHLISHQQKRKTSYKYEEHNHDNRTFSASVICIQNLLTILTKLWDVNEWKKGMNTMKEENCRGKRWKIILYGSSLPELPYFSLQKLLILTEVC